MDKLWYAFIVKLLPFGLWTNLAFTHSVVRLYWPQKHDPGVGAQCVVWQHSGSSVHTQKNACLFGFETTSSASLEVSQLLAAHPNSLRLNGDVQWRCYSQTSNRQCKWGYWMKNKNVKTFFHWKISCLPNDTFFLVCNDSKISFKMMIQWKIFNFSRIIILCEWIAPSQDRTRLCVCVCECVCHRHTYSHTNSVIRYKL